MLAKGLGIESRLDPVLSFPLGANSITLLEAAKVYSTIASAEIYSLAGDKKRRNQALIISKIMSVEGDIIYEAKTKETSIIDRRSSYLVADMLRNVVVYGTGRGARGKILLSSSEEKRAGVLNNLAIKIPAYGKTGTSNDYRNSSFVGFIPGFDRKKQVLNLKENYVIATYLGYDDNRPMKNETLRIFGSSGALPVWIEVANAIASSSIYHKNLDLVDLAFQSRTTLKTKAPSKALPVWVDVGSGVLRDLGSSKIDSSKAAMVHAFGKRKGDDFIPDRWFVPFTGDSIEPRHQGEID
jgi:membrane peptidoglycan carboxypeptidase